MTKSQLIEQVAQRLSATPFKSVEAIVNAVFGAMEEALCRGDRIEIRGFGVFGVRTRQAKQARNPKTGAAVQVPQRRAAFFSVGKELHQRLNPAPAAQAPLVASAAMPEAQPMLAAARETL